MTRSGNSALIRRHPAKFGGRVIRISQRRVVITGMGILSPVGIGIEETWSSLLAGKSGIREITLFDASDYPVRIGGQVWNFEAGDYFTWSVG